MISSAPPDRPGLVNKEGQGRKEEMDDDTKKNFYRHAVHAEDDFKKKEGFGLVDVDAGPRFLINPDEPTASDVFDDLASEDGYAGNDDNTPDYNNCGMEEEWTEQYQAEMEQKAEEEASELAALRAMTQGSIFVKNARVRK